VGRPINARRTFQLQQRGIEKIIVVGFLANTCVEATARCSAELGYHVTLVRDATAAFSSEAVHPRRCGWVLTPNGRGRGGDTGPTDGSPPRASGARDRRTPRPRVVKITAHRFRDRAFGSVTFPFTKTEITFLATGYRGWKPVFAAECTGPLEPE
jgi:hypothetical protein